MVEVYDTLREVTTITIRENEKGDTLKLVQMTDRTRATDRAAARDKEEKLVVRTDTVYIERRDSVLVQSSRFKVQGDSLIPRPSSLILTLKWIFWILVAGIVLIIAVRFGLRRSLF